MLHHISIRTANIHRSITFYSALGFEMSERFTTGYTLACWLVGRQSRLELIQIPEPHPAPDAFHDEHYVGYYHLALDVTTEAADLTSWLNDWKIKLATNSEFLIDPQILLAPHQQQIGDQLYEIAFITDPDGLPIELLCHVSGLNVTKPSV
jgi:catechol 2,3-dioxygenase-like lactoylglutathione lyase family enzyme